MLIAFKRPDPFSFLALAGLGFKKAAHGIELTKVESENKHVR